MEIKQIYCLAIRPDAYCPLHINPELEAVYVRRGSLTVVHDSGRLRLQAGELTLIQPYHLHGFRWEEQPDATVYMFSREVSQEFSDSAPCRACRIQGAAADYIRELCLRCPADQDLLTARALFYAFASVYMQGRAPSQPSGEKSMAKVVEYIFRNLEQELSLADIARHTGWEPRRLSAEFRAEYGMKLTDLVGNIRIERAANLLESTDFSISEIASGCGFGSLRSFNRIFRTHHHCTPTDYRQSLRKPTPSSSQSISHL